MEIVGGVALVLLFSAVFGAQMLMFPAMWRGYRDEWRRLLILAAVAVPAVQESRRARRRRAQRLDAGKNRRDATKRVTSVDAILRAWSSPSS